MSAYVRSPPPPVPVPDPPELTDEEIDSRWRGLRLNIAREVLVAVARKQGPGVPPDYCARFAASAADSLLALTWPRPKDKKVPA